MGEVIPAISLWQPWASLLFTPAKPDETRSWAPPERVRGRRIAIHAAKRKPTAYELTESRAWQVLCIEHLGQGWLGRVPFGAVIGTARLESYRRIVMPPAIAAGSEANLLSGNWAAGRYAWRYVDHQLFDAPVPLVGRQGFFTFDMESVHGA